MPTHTRWTQRPPGSNGGDSGPDDQRGRPTLRAVVGHERLMRIMRQDGVAVAPGAAGSPVTSAGTV